LSVLNFLKFKNLHHTTVEKLDMKWVTLKRLQSLQLRNVFSKTVLQHLDIFEALTKQTVYSLEKFCATHSQLPALNLIANDCV
jgi:hypothetical protein